MPMYEFQCLQCDREFEKLVMGRNSTAIDCPDCGTAEVEKKFSVFGIKSSRDFSSSASGGGCGSCTSNHCSTCH